MELVVSPHHPAAAAVGSSVSTHCVDAPSGTATDNDHHDGPAAAPTYHDDDCDCAVCLIATGRADDVTAHYITPTGRLRS